MRLPAPEVRANVSSSSSESDFGSHPNQRQERNTPTHRVEKERAQRAQTRGPSELQVPLHVGICRNCRRLYNRSEVRQVFWNGIQLTWIYYFRADKVFTMMTCSFRGEEKSRNTGDEFGKVQCYINNWNMAKTFWCCWYLNLFSKTYGF